MSPAVSNREARRAGRANYDILILRRGDVLCRRLACGSLAARDAAAAAIRDTGGDRAAAAAELACIPAEHLDGHEVVGGSVGRDRYRVRVERLAVYEDEEAL